MNSYCVTVLSVNVSVEHLFYMDFKKQLFSNLRNVISQCIHFSSNIYFHFVSKLSGK